MRVRVYHVTLTCLWKKCTLSVVLIAALPLHPSTGHSCGPAAVGNNIWCVCGSTYGGWSPTAVSLPRPIHTDSVYVPPSTPPPVPHHSQFNAPLPSVWPGIWFPPPSSAVHILLLTGYPLCGRGGRSFRKSSCRFSKKSHCVTTWPGCQTLLATRPGPSIRPGHHSRRKRRHGVVPPFLNRPALLRLLSPMKSSDAPLHPPPR